MKQVSLFDSFLKKQKSMQAPPSSTTNDIKKDEIRAADKQASIESLDVDITAKIENFRLSSIDEPEHK